VAPRPEPVQRLADALADVIAMAVERAAANPTATPGHAIAVGIADAAERLGVSAVTVKRLVASGELPSVLVGDRRLIPASALDAFIAQKLAG